VSNTFRVFLRVNSNQPSGSAKKRGRQAAPGLFLLLSMCIRTILDMSIFSDSFLVCLPRGVEYFPENPECVLPDPALERMKGKESICLEEMAIVRVFIVSVGLSSTTELAFGNCGKH